MIPGKIIHKKDVEVRNKLSEATIASPRNLHSNALCNSDRQL